MWSKIWIIEVENFESTDKLCWQFTDGPNPLRREFDIAHSGPHKKVYMLFPSPLGPTLRRNSRCCWTRALISQFTSSKWPCIRKRWGISLSFLFLFSHHLSQEIRVSLRFRLLCNEGGKKKNPPVSPNPLHKICICKRIWGSFPSVLTCRYHF